MYVLELAGLLGSSPCSYNARSQSPPWSRHSCHFNFDLSLNREWPDGPSLRASYESWFIWFISSI